MDSNKKHNFNSDLSICLQSLDSHKITERKIQRQEIQRLLDINEVIAVLNYNSTQQLNLNQSQSIDGNGYLVTWKCLLNCYHRSLILEVENEDKKKQKLGNSYKQSNLENYSILLRNIINKANKENPYLPCDDLLKCILDVSQNNTFQLFMGEVYYKILEQCILSQSYYWHSLSSHWNDLFSLAYNLYNADFANMRHVSIKIMKHIVVRGDAHSSVSLAIKKKILSYLKQAIMDTLKINSNYSLREDLIYLVFGVCKTLWIECRKSLCQFIEENCTHLINFYENDRPKKVQESLYNMLTLFIKMHHPKCNDFKHEESYAYDKNMWIIQLYQIYEFVRREIHQIKNNSNPNFSNYISELAVTIFNIVYFNDLDSLRLDLDKCPTPKRKKYDINILSFVDDLINLKKSEISTRLDIIIKLLENHSLPYHEKDYIHLLERITKCLNSYKDTNSTKYLITCCNVLIKSEYIIKLNQVEPFLKTVWTYALKMVMSNENSDLSHELLQSIIVLINWHDEMYSDVLRPYFNKTVKIDDPSLKTLVILFKTRGFCSASLNKINMILLLDWLLPLKAQDELLMVESFSKVNPYLFSEVVDLILTRPSIKKSFVHHNNLKTISSNDFMCTNFYLAPQHIPNVKQQLTKPAQNKSVRRSIDENIFDRLINFIKQSIELKEKPSIVILQLFFSLTNFLCFLENQFPQINDDYEDFRFYKFNYMEKVNNIVTVLENDVNQIDHEAFVSVCSLFYKNLKFVDGTIVNELMNHKTNKFLMSKLYNLSKLNDSNIMYQVLDYDRLTKKQKLSIQAIKALLRTCLFKGQTSYQTPLLENLVEDLKDLEFCQSYIYFKITNFLCIALSLDNLSIDMIIQINKFIKQLAKAWCSHHEGFIKIIQLLNDALQITTKNNLDKVCTTNLLMLIKSLQKISITKNCGPKMVCAFVDLLGNFASINNGNFGSTWNINTNAVQPMSPENILSYLNHPFLQVRIAAIRYIKVMCNAYENNPNTYIISYEEMVDIIIHKIHEGFTVDSDISEEEYEDEYTNRISTYLLCMQSLITSSVKYRKKCLLEVLQTVNVKKIDLNLVINLFECVKMELKMKSYMELLENNLNFLLWKWHLKYSTFKEFPIKLFSCTTIEQFFKKYAFEVIPILVIKNDLDVINSMGILFEVIEENFPVIFSYILAMDIVEGTNSAIKNLIENELGKKHFIELTRSHCSDIVLQFIQMVVINTEQPIVPIQISSDQFLILIEIFQKEYVKTNYPLLTIISMRRPDYIQTIVHTLYVNIFKNSTSELWCQSFFQYTFFMKLLISQLSDYSEKDDFSYFLINQSVKSTITLLNQNNFEMQNYAIEYFEWLLLNTRRFLILNISQIGHLTSTLGILAKKQLNSNEKLLNLLNNLKNLRNVQNIQRETNQENESTLHKDINSFISQQNENTDIIQSLNILKLKLQTNEKELQDMYQELLNMRGFSEDCVKSVLHCLTCTLIKLTKSDDFAIQILAASCLGILGPADLTTLILQPEPEVLKLESNTTLEYSFIKHIVELVLNCLSDDNISVLEASNITLFKVISTIEGQSLYEELGRKVLYPYKLSQIEELDIELSFDIEQFNLLIDEKEIWCPIDSSISYNEWITNITKHLLETLQGFCNSLLPIAENKPMFCESILPHLVYFLLEYKPLTRHLLNKHLNCFFIKHYEMKIKKSAEKNNTHVQVYDAIENNIYCNKSAVQCLLSIIHFIRLQQNNPLQTILDINYLYVSQAAQFCSAHFTSIQYLELWCETEFKRINKDKETMVFNPVDVITEILPEDGLLLQSILNESYKSIGDIDAIEGCGSSYLLTLSSRTQYYQQLRKWDRVMENCDLQQTTEVISKDYLEAFSNSGLQNIAHIMASNNDNLKYDYCWQLNKWDLPDNGDKSFESLHYHALQNIHLNNLDRAIPMIDEARLIVIESLYCASLESTATIYTPLAKLKIIEDLEDFISTPVKKNVFDKWLNQNSLRTNDFVNINKILSQRCILLDFDGDKRSGILRLKIAELAQKNDCLQEAGRHLATVATLKNIQKHTSLWAKVEETRLLWKRNDCHMARVLLKCVVEELENYEYPFLFSLALQLYGSWMEETKSETSSDIIRKYFLKSIKEISKLEFAENEEFGLDRKKVLSDAHKNLSQFTDRLYQQLYKYIKTEDFQKRIHEVEDSIIKGKALIDLGKLSKNIEKQKAGIFLKKQSEIDKSDIDNKNQEKNKYLKLTLQHYLQLMTLDDESKLPIYRIVSLWLENKENNEINLIVEQEFNKNPTYKFITILPQLVAHLSSTYEYSFHKSLETLINNCAMDHPYQTIPIVYAVANTNIDQTIIQREQPINKEDKEETRVLAAQRLMSKWKRNTKISSIVINTEKLYEALIQLAYAKLSCSQGQRMPIPNEQPLMKIQYSELYMYPAATLPLNKHGDYPNIISIVRFENSFLNPGGIHQPKKIDCLCSDGILRSLLLKGYEDMHQDAIMQQVFVLMNRLLNSNKSTAKRKLTIRTYNVIPFSQRSGIAEWCSNTMSVADYLVGTNSIVGAHQKYRPDDMLPTEARQILRESHEIRDTELKKQKKYSHICKNLKPVFRYYFFEKFLSPSIWFERRQAFIHSVATTSMVGYILGLGDRHFQNILIDNSTAEFIHIDFGIAFEQGTLLTTPETVPFRLTRDIVDGMGICGIEGTFRKCCEKTMSVLRQNQDVILTVIEVLLYDPCYEWTLTEEKAAQLQNPSKNSHINETTEVNKLAERALNKIRVKLNGMEQPETAAASINGQVNLLIQKARDPNNLALIFHGWQAYL